VIRVLFVDDDPNVLQGLRRMLRAYRHEWDMAFAGDGGEALALLERERFDVIVSDMRMPGMDGAELLSRVQDLHPHMVRIILSGQSEKEEVMRALGPTHQYLAKPCEPQALQEAIGSVLQLREVLENEHLKGLVAQLHTVPSLPSVYREVVAELRSDDPSIQRIGQLIARDAGMTAKVLQLANSAFFSPARYITSTTDAAALLGTDTIQSLVLSAHVFKEFAGSRASGLGAEALAAHSLKVSLASRELCRVETATRAMCETALIAGMLHDLGKLVLAANMPTEYAEAIERARTEGLPMRETEALVLGASHAEVGAYLVGLWGLPHGLVEALAYHHAPSRCPPGGFSVLTAVHVANALINAHDASPGSLGSPALDASYLDRLGLTSRLELWQERCASVGDRGRGEL
jgi:HD-like signal output (HDOD) protein/CheY-like chemotaxis protein